MAPWTYSVDMETGTQYFQWVEGHRYNLMVRVGEFDSLGTFHKWNSDYLMAIL